MDNIVKNCLEAGGKAGYEFAQKRGRVRFRFYSNQVELVAKQNSALT